jgi:hypothetical protein
MPAGTPRRRIIAPQKEWDLSGILDIPAVIGERMINQSFVRPGSNFKGAPEWGNLPIDDRLPFALLNLHLS